MVKYKCYYKKAIMRSLIKKIKSISLFSFSMFLLSYPGGVKAQGLGVGTAGPVSKLDVNGNLTVGATYAGTNAAPTSGAIIQGNVGIGLTAPNGRLHLYEATGTTVTSLAGTLILQHGNSGGTSGILFKSAAEPTDYGYIRFSDDGSGTGSSSEDALLEIGIANDPSTNSYEDDIAFMPSGNLGINTRSPNSTLHVAGAYQGMTKSVSSSVTLADDDWFVVATNNSTTTITLPTLTSPTTDGKILYIRAKGGASTSITIAAAAGNTISTHTHWVNPMADGEGITLTSVGTVWYVVTGD
jgi:hypothetical protein